MTIEERLTKLERRNRYLALTLGVLMVCSVLLGFTAQAKEEVPDVLRAKKFELVDSIGNVLGKMESKKSGEAIMELVSTSSGASVTLGIKEDGSAGLLLSRSKDRSEVELMMGNDGMVRLAFMDREGTVRSAYGLAESGSPVFGMQGPGAELSMFADKIRIKRLDGEREVAAAMMSVSEDGSSKLLLGHESWGVALMVDDVTSALMVGSTEGPGVALGAEKKEMQAAVVLADEKGTEAVTIQSKPNGFRSIDLSRVDGKLAARLLVLRHLPANEKTTTGAPIRLGTGMPSLYLYDRKGTPRALLGLLLDESSVLSLTDEEGNGVWGNPRAK